MTTQCWQFSRMSLLTAEAITMNSLPLEIQEKILSFITDSFTLYRLEKVCKSWAAIIARLERHKNLRFRKIRILDRLTKIESFNESIGISEDANEVGVGKMSSNIAALAEKVFLTHMEIIRLKYPGTLHKMRSARNPLSQNPKFAIQLVVDPDPIIIQGVGVFLPHGENCQADVQVAVWIGQDSTDVVGPVGQIIAFKEILVSRSDQLANAKMCINHQTGSILEESETSRCYPGPGQVSQHRKHKRRCLGIHPYPVMLDQGVEIHPGHPYCIGMQIHMPDHPGWTVETVWGGGGEETSKATCCQGRKRILFKFAKLQRNDVRSSLSSGQIPVIYYS